MDMLKKAVHEITSHYDKMGADAFINEIKNHDCPLQVETAFTDVIHYSKIVMASEALMPAAIAISILMNNNIEDKF